MSAKPVWTPAMLARLRERWDGGESYSDIADKVTAEFHVKLTRNSVASILRRLREQAGPGDWDPAPRGSPIMLRLGRPAKAVDRSVRKSVHGPVDRPIEPPPPEVRPQWGCWRLTDLNSNQCHHITGTHPNFLYCGAPVARGCYCAEHVRRMFSAPRPRT